MQERAGHQRIEGIKVLHIRLQAILAGVDDKKTIGNKWRRLRALITETTSKEE